MSQSKPETKHPSYRDKEGVLLNALEWRRLRKSDSYCTVAETLVDGQLVRTFWEGIDGEVGAGCMWTTGVGTGDSLTTVWEGRWPVTEGEARAAHALTVKDLHLRPEDRRFNSLGHAVIPCINCRRWTFDNNAGTCCVPCGYKSPADGSDTRHQWLCGKNHELKRYFPRNYSLEQLYVRAAEPLVSDAAEGGTATRKPSCARTHRAVGVSPLEARWLRVQRCAPRPRRPLARGQAYA